MHLYCGQEAVSTGVIRHLNQDDYICSTYRDHVHALSKGVPPREIMAELFGKKTGICRGQGGSMHMFSKTWGLVRLSRPRAQIQDLPRALLLPHRYFIYMHSTTHGLEGFCTRAKGVQSCLEYL